MSSFASLISESRYFPQTTEEPSQFQLDNVSPEAVKDAVRSILGANFEFTENSVDSSGLELYDILSRVLPFSPHNSFFWEQLARPFASMLDTARFPLTAQLTYLVFVYARVLGFMGPTSGPHSIMTVDGSAVELSWVIPNRSAPAIGEPTRQIRFAIEPLHPETGVPFRGADVLEYLTSSQGHLNVVKCAEGGMNWRKSTENFLFPDAPADAIPEGSRFFVGFDFTPTGTLTLKAYYLAAARPPAVSLQKNRPEDHFPIYCGDVDLTPLRKLMPELHPSMAEPLETILDYVDSLEDRLKPRFQILALDCVPDKSNRLKIYCRAMEGTSWQDAKRSFTLGGRISSPSMDASLASLEILWNKLFPTAPSFSGHELDVSATADQGHNQEDESDPDHVHSQHPVGGILYYYELVAGKNEVFPKIYLPVRHYCNSDLVVSEGVEAFYNEIGVKGPVGGETGPGWVAREVAKAYSHRPLDKLSGIQTYVTFALKKAGWELTSYFSPEIHVR